MLLPTLLSLFTSSILVSAVSVPRMLEPDEVLLHGANGRVEIMKRDEWHALSKRTLNLTSTPPAPITSSQQTISNTTERADVIEKRGGCKQHEIVTEYPVENFLGWDVPMSAVTKPLLRITIDAGKTISNSLTTSSKLGNSKKTLTDDKVKEFLLTSRGASFTQTWTSDYSTSYSWRPVAGYYTVVVSNPLTTRYKGRVDAGCIGEPNESLEYQADVYSSTGYSELNWVDGVISICQSETYPIPRCIGEGMLE